eukprot:GFKZ01004139.1.p1 GENE.GFKZ01004139.1~~GFKZ01004139.1.p1  ORF type:complete len:805 (+),score=111.30 GFKZ01004139.1:238-2415(+)
MVPEICRLLVESPHHDVQLAAAEALFYVVNIRIPAYIARVMLVAALDVVRVTDIHVDVFDGCGEILSMILPQVEKEDAVNLVIPATMQRAVATRPQSRRLAARLIGALHESISPPSLESMFLTHALNLASDADPSVRAMMAQSLGPVAETLPLRLVESKVWPKLNSLLADDNVRVKAAAMRSLAKSAQIHAPRAANSSFFSGTLRPMFLDECQRATAVAGKDLRNVSDETYLMLEIFAEVYGYLLHALDTLFDRRGTEWKVAWAAFRAMSSCNGPTVRHWCAFNMPAVARVMGEYDREMVIAVVQSLAGDSDMETRATLASGIKEVVSLLAKGEGRSEIIQSITMLFMDESTQVRMNALQHLSELLKLLSPGEEVNLARARAALKAEQLAARGESGDHAASMTGTYGANEDPEVVDREMRRLAKIFSSLEMMPFDSWRTQQILAEELRKSAHLVPQQMLCENVAPLLFQMARESTYLVRKASMRALMHVLRYIPDVRRRNHIFKHLRTEWARGKVYWTRLAFIDGAEFALEVVSTKLFNSMFKKELLRLIEDSVPNVKSRLLRLFSKLLSRWKTSREFVDALQVLARDPDPQVRKEATDMLKRLQTVGPLPEHEAREERMREAREEAFFVHRPKRRKPESSQKSGQTPVGAPAPPRSGKVENAAVTEKPSNLRQTVEELKGVPPSSSPHVDLKERRKAIAAAETAPVEPPPKPSFFARLFGSCCG